MSDWVKLTEAVSNTRDCPSIVKFAVDTRDLHTTVELTTEGLNLESLIQVNEVLEVLYDKEWVWWKNMKCKYVRFTVDPMTKMCNLFDRKGNPITLEQLKKQ